MLQLDCAPLCPAVFVPCGVGNTSVRPKLAVTRSENPTKKTQVHLYCNFNSGVLNHGAGVDLDAVLM